MWAGNGGGLVSYLSPDQESKDLIKMAKKEGVHIAELVKCGNEQDFSGQFFLKGEKSEDVDRNAFDGGFLIPPILVSSYGSFPKVLEGYFDIDDFEFCLMIKEEVIKCRECKKKFSKEKYKEYKICDDCVETIKKKSVGKKCPICKGYVVYQKEIDCPDCYHYEEGYNYCDKCGVTWGKEDERD